MKKKVIIYGDTNFAKQLKYCFDTDSNYEVEAFTVHKQFRNLTRLEGLPVIDFEKAVTDYPPVDYSFFVAIGYTKMNAVRAEIMEELRSLGYDLVNHIASSAICKAETLGCNVFINDMSYVGEYAKIGNGCILNSKIIVGHRSVLKDNVFIGGAAVIAGDVVVENNCFIGDNSTIANGLIIGSHSFIGAAAYINKSTEAGKVYVAAPAKKINVSSIIAQEGFL